MSSLTTLRRSVPTSSAAIGSATPQAVREPMVVSTLQLIRRGKPTSFLDVRPAWSSATVRWKYLTLEDYVVPSCLISRHQHPEPFVHVVLSGSVNYEVTTGNSTRRFLAVPGTTFIL